MSDKYKIALQKLAAKSNPMEEAVPLENQKLPNPMEEAVPQAKPTNPMEEAVPLEKQQLPNPMEAAVLPDDADGAIEDLESPTVDLNNSALERLPRPAGQKDLIEGVKDALRVKVSKEDMDTLSIQKEIENRRKNKRSDDKTADAALEKEETLEDLEEDGSMESIFDGLGKSVGEDFSDEDKQNIKDYVLGQGKRWTFLSEDDKTTNILGSYIGLYYQLKEIGGFTGEHFDMELVASDEIAPKKYDELRKKIPHIFSPAAFFDVLASTNIVKEKSKESDEIIKVTPQTRFAQYIFTMTHNPQKDGNYSVDQLKILRNKKQYKAQEIGGFVQEKLEEIMLKLQKYVDKKMQDEEGEISVEHGLYLTPYFEFTDDDEENSEGIEVAKLASKNNGKQYIDNLIKTSAGYVTSIVMKGIFEKEFYQKVVEANLRRQKFEAVEGKGGTKERDEFRELSPEQATVLIDDVMFTPETEIPTDSDVGKFIANLYGFSSNTGKLTKEERQQGVSYHVPEGDVKIIAKPGSNSILILSDIIDNENKAQFEGEDPRLVDKITKAAKAFAGQDEAEEPNEKAKQIIDNMFLFAKVFKIEDEKVIEDKTPEAITRIKAHKKMPPNLPLLYGTYGEEYFKAVAAHKEAQAKRKEEKAKAKAEAKTKAPKTPKAPKEKAKKKKATKAQLKSIIGLVYDKKDNEGFDFNDTVLKFLNYIKSIIDIIHKDDELKVSYDGVADAFIKKIEADKFIPLNKMESFIDMLGIPES